MVLLLQLLQALPRVRAARSTCRSLVVACAKGVTMSGQQCGELCGQIAREQSAQASGM
jgi:hypothetical protein